jgi:hypothetical protein
MKTAKTIIFTGIISLFLFVATATPAEHAVDTKDTAVLSDKYAVIIVSGDKAIELSLECKCRFIVNDEQHFVVFLNLPEGLCT